MIKPPSLQSGFSLVWSKDPALKLPEDPDEAARALKVATETGNWSSLIADGQQPSVFHFEALTRRELGWWDGERRHSQIHARPLSPIEANDLLIRIALRSVDNFGPHKVERTAAAGGVPGLADEKIIEVINTAAPSALAEFADAIIERSRGPRPLF